MVVHHQPQLFIIPTPIYEGGEVDISDLVFDRIHTLKYFCVENLKSARRHLRSMKFKANFDTEVQFFEWDKHQDIQDYSKLKQWFEEAKDIGLMSDAGMPCIADPGSEIVRLAHQYNYKVNPLVGPSSILLALIASGMNGQNFSFQGYLPIEKTARVQKLKQMEQKIHLDGQTQIFMETPYRNLQMIDDVIQNCDSKLNFCVASNISSPDSLIINRLIKDWKTLSCPDIHKIPTIFVLGR